LWLIFSLLAALAFLLRLLPFLDLATPLFEGVLILTHVVPSSVRETKMRTAATRNDGARFSDFQINSASVPSAASN
jgi:hypothetical protein